MEGPIIAQRTTARPLAVRATATRIVLPTLVAMLLSTFPPLAGPAVAAPRTPKFGPMIEGYAPYDGQSRCSPTPKPGLVAFQNMVLDAYPGTTSFGIGRDCSVGGTSEHKEGRAWDWGVSAGVPAERAKAEDLLDWLLSEDSFGQPAALARRLGVMYIVWNRRIWGAWSGEWATYCVQKNKACRDPDSGSALHPHTDHVHFSFSWAGARKKTSFWQRRRSHVVDMAAAGSGYWLAGGNGRVEALGVSSHGSLSGGYLGPPMVDMAATPGGGGYWLVNRAGRVFAFGDARNHGRVKADGVRIADLAATPTGQGYWLVARDGRVFRFGDAVGRGGAFGEGATISGMAATQSGQGYWLFATDGRVFGFGDAKLDGDASDRGLRQPVVGGAGLGNDGYWLVTRMGRVFAFGTAKRHETLDGDSTLPPVAGMAATPTGDGYWLAGRMGKVRAFGAAPGLGGLQ